MSTVVKQVRAQLEWFRSVKGETDMYGFDLTLLGHMVRSSSYIYMGDFQNSPYVLALYNKVFNLNQLYEKDPQVFEAAFKWVLDVI